MYSYWGKRYELVLAGMFNSAELTINDEARMFCNALMMITGVIETFATCRWSLNVSWCMYWCSCYNQRCAATLVHTHGCHIKKRNGKLAMREQASYIKQVETRQFWNLVEKINDMPLMIFQVFFVIFPWSHHLEKVTSRSVWLGGRCTPSTPRVYAPDIFMPKCDANERLMIQTVVVQLQARGPHVARHSVSSGPWKHSGKTFRSEICWKTCEVTFVSLNCLHWINRMCTRTMNNTFSMYHFASFICFTIKLEGTARPAANPPLGYLSG